MGNGVALSASVPRPSSTLQTGPAVPVRPVVPAKPHIVTEEQCPWDVVPQNQEQIVLRCAAAGARKACARKNPFAGFDQTSTWYRIAGPACACLPGGRCWSGDCRSRRRARRRECRSRDEWSRVAVAAAEDGGIECL